jgi:hypothetical protein
MPRSHAKAALSLWAVFALSPLIGCTDPGLPWGVVEATIQASFDPSEGRLDDEGRLKTSANYALELESVVVSFDALTLTLAGAGAADFDPANPPDGYSLCHNGHCHSDSGALVDYEVIALEMAGGSSGARVTLGLDTQGLELDSEAVTVGLTPCDPSPCALPIGEMAGLELTLASVSVRGTAFDRLTGDKARLGPEGVAFEATLTGPQTVLAQIEGSVGPGEPVGVELAIGFKLPPELFDDADFGAESPIDAAAWQTLWGDALSDHGGLEVVMTRNN